MNHSVLPHLHPDQVEVEIWRADELEVRRGLSSELDEMWSYVRSKAHPRWLWHAIDHQEVFQKWRWSLSYCPSKGIAVHKQANDDVVHLRRFREADRLTDQAFNACA